MLRCVAQGWFEVTNAEPGQRSLHAVHKPGAFLDQALALPIGPLGVLFGKRRHAHHAAMAPFPSQPPRSPRFSNSLSSRSVLARRCSRDTATLEGWITCAST